MGFQPSSHIYLKCKFYLIEDCDSHLEGDPGDDRGVEEQVEDQQVLTKSLFGQLRLVQVVLEWFEKNIKRKSLVIGLVYN